MRSMLQQPAVAATLAATATVLAATITTATPLAATITTSTAALNAASCTASILRGQPMRLPQYLRLLVLLLHMQSAQCTLHWRVLALLCRLV